MRENEPKIEDKISDYRASEQLSAGDIKRIYKESRLTPFESKVEHLNGNEFFKVYDVATGPEKMLMQGKIYSSIKNLRQTHLMTKERRVLLGKFLDLQK